MAAEAPLRLVLVTPETTLVDEPVARCVSRSTTGRSASFPAERR